MRKVVVTPSVIEVSLVFVRPSRDPYNVFDSMVRLQLTGTAGPDRAQWVLKGGAVITGIVILHVSTQF